MTLRTNPLFRLGRLALCIGLFLCPFFMISCKKDDVYLSVDRQDIVLSAKQETVNIKVDSNSEWSVEGQNREAALGAPIAEFDWFSVEPYYGRATQSVAIKLVLNKIPQESKKSIVVIKSKSRSRSLTIKFEKD